MRKLIENDEFKYSFDTNILERGMEYYKSNRILDIWCQDNIVTSYIDGSQIYKVKLEIKNNELIN